MKHTFIALSFILSLFSLTAQNAHFDHYYFTEASTLTMIGKIIPTENPYHRVDTNRFKGFTQSENLQVRCPAGLAVAFKTNSPSLAIYTQYGYAYTDLPSTNGIAYRGYDLYIKKDGKWLFAAAGVLSMYHLNDTLRLIKGMDNSEKECLLYLPLYSETYSIQIGVENGTEIHPLANPFRYRIGIYGSSFTHGVSTSRPSMCYPSQLSRTTGLEFLNLGCSGNCRMQDYFADVLCAADVDALVFDAFSNPSVTQIKKRLFPFIERMQAAHPGIPLIFQRTIRREGRNFRIDSEKEEQERINVADSLMAIAVKKYKDVYYIHPNASSPQHEASVDGTHPDNHGYTLWAKSVEKPILKILKKYGIQANSVTYTQKRPFSEYNYTEASKLTMIGKMFPNTPNPYHMVDTCRFKGFTPIENQQIRLSAGLAVAFRTNSPTLVIYTDFILASVDLTDGSGTMGRGYTLYIKKNGQWTYAAAEKLSMHHLSDTMRIGSTMDTSMKECLLYFPLSSEERSIQIGTEKGSRIEAIPNPFRHRIAVFGSSYTRGTSSSRPGMGYTEQFSRHTGLQTVSIGCNGNARLQPYFADLLCSVNADAFLFDVFSNPSAAEMRERFFPFLEKISHAHPGTPLIFQQTIRREGQNFDLEEDACIQERMRTADSLMSIAVKKYDNVYYIQPQINDPEHLCTVDGIHPDNYGYFLWSKSIEKPVLKILRKYGIK